MKTLKLFAIIAGALAVMALSSCEQQVAKKTIEFTFHIEDVTAINAQLEISATGDEAALVRYLAPVPETEVLAVVGSLTDEAKVKEYLKNNGVAIELPYNALLKDLNTETTYVVGVVAFDENMDAFGYRVETFTTLDMSSLTDRAVGDPSNVGNLTENVLK